MMDPCLVGKVDVPLKASNNFLHGNPASYQCGTPGCLHVHVNLQVPMCEYMRVVLYAKSLKFNSDNESPFFPVKSF